MTSKAKLILGTANFSPKPYGQLKEPLSLVDIRFILEYAKKHGVTMLESSEAYDCDGLLNDHNFELIYKVTHPYNINRVLERTGRSHLMGLMYHHGQETRGELPLPDSRVLYRGSSIYDSKQLIGTEQMVEVPLNLEDRRFEKITAQCKLVRSVFGRGELLKKYTVKECLDYVKNNPTIHGVIIGVDNVKQLEEILEAWNK